MAISEDRLVITGDAAGALREYAKLLDANKSLKQEMRDLRKQAKDTGDGMTGSLGEGLRQLGHQVAGWVSVGAAIAGVNRLLSEQRRLGQELADTNLKIIRSAGEAIAAAGDATQAPRIMKALEEMPGAPGVRMGERVGVYQAIRGAAPGMELDRRLGMVAAALRTEEGGMKPAEVGATAAGLGEIFKGWSPGKAVDVAVRSQQLAGGAAAKLDAAGIKIISQWAEAGLGTPEEGLGYMLAAMRSGQKPMILTSMIAKATEDKRVTEPGPEGKLLREFYGTPRGAGRLAQFGRRDLSNALFGAQGPAIAALMARGPGAIAAELQGAEGTTDRLIADMAKLPGWEQMHAIEEYGAKAETEGVKGPYGTRQLRIKAVVDAIRAERRVRSPRAVESVADFEAWLTAETNGPYFAAGWGLSEAGAKQYRETFYGEGPSSALREAANKLERQAPDRTSFPGGENP
jgi:hypothetical protein